MGANPFFLTTVQMYKIFKLKNGLDFSATPQRRNINHFRM